MVRRHRIIKGKILGKLYNRSTVKDGHQKVFLFPSEGDKLVQIGLNGYSRIRTKFTSLLCL